ncbi:hypothetical protein RN607_11065 [Demequina capsici]|uniref:Glycosyltransferase RgtA/B/C/D-like domain-containing protein n=1 Tax=Demequina capsici TaxID=3075620 RepID=A0AA96JCB2_9MICO|nr:hypothetical protein [Demequina sp. PMTSA13]WNM26731.1 hypothetical protein RN607_11065 [Demequina sp. PMTSA13]
MLPPSTEVDAGSAPRSGPRSRLQDALSAAPSAIVLVTVAIATSAGLLVSIGQHRWWTVLPLAVALAAAMWRHVVSADPHPRAPLAGALLVGGLLAWTIVNIVFAAEYLIVLRDPGFLTLSGMWLVDHASTDIPASGAVQAAALQANLIPDASQAWNLLGDVVQPQGAKMLPATIAVGGWVAGTTGVLAANVVVGASGLSAIYLLARRVLSPMAALAPAAMMALTVAHIGLSRAPYTEPLTLLLVVASMLWTWQGVTSRSRLLLLSGAFVSGLTTFVRIDGALIAVGVLLGAVAALSTSDAPRRWRTTSALLFAAVQTVTLAGGYLSLHRWSQAYLDRLSGEAIGAIAVFAAGLAVSVVWAACWGSRLRADRVIPAISARLGQRGSLWASGLVVAVLLFMVSRPWWMIARRGTESSDDKFANGVIQQFQESAGFAVDPTRTYAENTMTWISYYLTWPIVVLAILGFAIITYRALRRGQGWWVLLASVLPSTLLYLWRPSIIPDQIWAIRRFEPSTLPGFVIAAAIAAWWLTQRLASAARRHKGRRVAAIAFIVLPLTTWVSIVPGMDPVAGVAVNVFMKEMDGARAQVDDLCAAIDGRPVVLAGTSSHFGTIRVGCDVPVVLALVEPTPETLAKMIDVFGEAPVVVTREQDWFDWTTEPGTVVDSTVTHSGYSLQRIPVTYITRHYAWRIGVVNTDGTVTPLATTGEVASAG